jgi:hypothetical protein
MNVLDATLQKRIIVARMTQILGDTIRARVWMTTLREEFADPEGAWHTANELIDGDQYDRVLKETDKLAMGE